MEVKNSQPNESETPTLIQGYLKKLKNTNALIRFVSKFTKRYFVLDLDVGTFYYCKSQTKRAPLKTHLITEIKSFTRDLMNIELSDWKFAFKVETTTKIYTLYCESFNCYQEWCKGFQKCVKDVTYLTIDENGITPEFHVRKDLAKRNVPRFSGSIDFTQRSELYKERQNVNLNPLLRRSYKENDDPSRQSLLSSAQRGHILEESEIFCEDLVVGDQTPSFPLKNIENATRQRSSSFWDAPSKPVEISTRPNNANWC